MTNQQISTSMHLTAECFFVFFFLLGVVALVSLSASYTINKLTPLFFYFVLFAEEFQRAVCISTGQTLDPYVVHTVFQLFDKDGEISHTMCACVLCTGRSFLSCFSALARLYYLAIKTAMLRRLEVFQMASFLLFSPQ